MAKFDLKIKAQALRRKGYSIQDIAIKLGVAKSTVSIWCRAMQLTKLEQQLIKRNAYRKGHKGRLAGAQKNKDDKQKRIQEAELTAKDMLSNITDRDRFLLGIGLYWGEGVKADQSTTAFVNSDVRSVIFMKQWFNDFFKVEESLFSPYVFISQQHKDRELEIRQYWSKQLNLPITQCNKVIYLKTTPKKVYENHKIYYGTLALRIKKSTDLKYLILGLIKHL